MSNEFANLAIDENSTIRVSPASNTLETKRIELPPFLVQNDKGVFVNVMQLDNGQSLQTAVSRIFFEGYYFSGLDYRQFIQLLYYFTPASAVAGSGELLVRFAADIVLFDPKRKPLYRVVKTSDGKAEYFFEPLLIEAEGNTPGLEPVMLPTSLSLDEFVAHLWNKGVRFGIDTDTVSKVIALGRSGLIVVARRLEATLGKNASIQEMTKAMHRDDKPKELPNGKIDLGQFTNRFPQIDKDTKLLKKLPPVMGTIGFELSGLPLVPPVPNDFDISALAGPGTRVEQIGEEEFIVSQQDGFLNLDTKTNQISISDKIIGRGGVNLRTTGDLHLSGEEYEEFGEVQEKRTLEGSNITIHADVFGNVASKGGNIALLKNLIGGTATNQKGDIAVHGFASGAVLHTKEGSIEIKRAERCNIIGGNVRIEHASNCDIVADTVTIQTAEGCAIAARTVKIINAAPYKQTDMTVILAVPNERNTQQEMDEINRELGKSGEEITRKTHAVGALLNLPDVKKYMMIASKLKQKEISLTPELKAGFQKLTAIATPTLRTISQTKAEIAQLQQEQHRLSDQLNGLSRKYSEDAEKISCVIRSIAGDVVVRALIDSVDPETLYDIPPKELGTKLRGPSLAGKIIFSGKNGSVDWTYHTSTD